MRKLFWSRWVFLPLSFALSACPPPPPGSFTPAGYQSPNGYTVRALAGADATRGELMPSDWQLDNYYWDRSGAGRPALTPKSTPEYKTKLAFDLDGDGRMDKVEDTFVHDLRWIHARHHGIIWVRSVPVSTTLRNVDLDVLLADYVNEISGAGYESVSLGTEEHSVAEHRYAARITRKTPGKLAGQEAIEARVEVANSEQLKLDPNARWQRLRLILARGPVDHDIKRMGEAKGTQFPVVLVVGYANSPEHFAEGKLDFQDLVSRFTVGDAAGFISARAAAADASAPEDEPSSAPTLSGSSASPADSAAPAAVPPVPPAPPASSAPAP